MLSLALPLDLTIRPSDLWDKYKVGRIGLRPFQNLVPETPEAWFELTFLIGGSALAGWLMMRLLSHNGRSQERRWLQLILSGLVFGSLLELMQLLVYSRASTVDDVILSSLGFAAGGLLLPWCANIDSAHSPVQIRLVRTILLAIYLGWLFLFYWWPLDITLNPESLLHRGRHFFRLPFAALYAGSYSNAAAEILRKTLVFAVLTILTTAVLDERRIHGLSRGSVLLGSFGVSLGIGILIELGQLALPSRTADLTDVLLYGTGAGCGVLLASYLQGSKATEVHR